MWVPDHHNQMFILNIPFQNLKHYYRVGPNMELAAITVIHLLASFPVDFEVWLWGYEFIQPQKY